MQSELERERVTLELEEEKRVQAEREKLLQEQANLMTTKLNQEFVWK